MTKAELQKDRDEWKQQAESLQDDLDSLNEAYSELEEINYKLSNNMDINSIYDLEDFIFRLKVDDLYTDELGKFIEDLFVWCYTALLKVGCSSVHRMH